MQKEYLPKNIEHYVQEYWKNNNTFQVNEDHTKEKYYCLPMLPYPSGKLHMGHVRNYTISDVIARYERMLGKNVLHPIGWDAFGLPAEEAAIKNNTIPSDWTNQNIKYMRKQLQSLGFSYDWNREITTCKPEYYKWEQWFFNKLYEKKLVYKKNSIVNWCAYDKTVLANEQVINGYCWRCQGEVIYKKIPQWFIKIRKYAESLYNDLNQLKDWPEKVKTMQRNWIGRIKGFDITIDIYQKKEKLTVFTDRLDALMGATYILISSKHKIAKKLSYEDFTTNISKNKSNNKILSLKNLEEIKYIGINTNFFAVHPITKKKIPIWISHVIQKEYGTDAVLGIPGHNEYAWHFAIENNLKIKFVIQNITHEKNSFNSLFTTNKGILFNSEEFNGLDYHNGIKEVYKKLLQKKIIKEKINYKLQDWCVSRQRYWGAPIPMATLKNGKIVAIPDNQLPVLLPDDINSIHDLKKLQNQSTDWSKVYINNEKATREKDTFDTFMESSWYYARYTCPNYNQGMINPVSSKYWLPVDQYIGGIEHAIMHLMYFRFYHKLLRDFKLVDFDEPVKNLICQGMVLAEAFYYIGKNSQRCWVSPLSVLKERNKKGEIIKAYTNTGKSVIYAGMIKMSKSKYNGIEPELIINKYGADTIRLFIMFGAPVESSLEWRESGVQGMYRFLKKIWKLTYFYLQKKHTDAEIDFEELNDKQKILYCFLHKTIDIVSADMKRKKTFNTAIAAIMKFFNALVRSPFDDIKDQYIMRKSLIAIIKMLYPFTPHICFMLWRYIHIKKNNNIDYTTWPIAKKEILNDNYSIVVIQVNGKKKCTIKVSKNATQEEIFLEVKKQTVIKKNINMIDFNNLVYIPHKIINFIVSNT
ncbi:leucine--tRNA ligase [Buchnera aphidicola]|uniref:leucine--tRNA ligase n=1 Tax=Buchnera aphidicola TaxID=9 RepID=UPI00346481D7